MYQSLLSIFLCFCYYCFSKQLIEPNENSCQVKDISLAPFAAMTTSYCEVKSQLCDAHHSHPQFHVSKLKDSVSTLLSNYIFYILRHNLILLENINSFSFHLDQEEAM
jgi:hypothetical protein